MGFENQLLQVFEKIKPHIEAEMAALNAYGLPETTINFYKGGVEVVTFDRLGQDYTVTFTPAIEERVELTRGKVQA